MIRRVIDRLSVWLAVVGVVGLMVVMVTMAADAFARKIAKPVPGAFETSILLMVVIIFLPQAYAQMSKTHVAMDLFANRMPPKLFAGIEGGGAVLAAGIFGLLTYWGWGKALHATAVQEFISGLVNYPVWPFRWVMVLGLGAMVLQFSNTAFDAFSRVAGRR